MLGRLISRGEKGRSRIGGRQQTYFMADSETGRREVEEGWGDEEANAWACLENLVLLATGDLGITAGRRVGPAVSTFSGSNFKFGRTQDHKCGNKGLKIPEN